MKKKIKLIIMIIALGVCATVLVRCALSTYPPTNESLIISINEDEIQYISFIEMLTTDQKIGTISSGFAFTIDKPFFDATPDALGVTEERLREYRNSMKSLGVSRVDRNKSGDVYFMKWHSGIGGNTHGKGVVWMIDPPATNDFRQLLRIRDNWHIYEY